MYNFIVAEAQMWRENENIKNKINFAFLALLFQPPENVSQQFCMRIYLVIVFDVFSTLCALGYFWKW